MASKNRTCLTCKTKYRYCPSCSRDASIAPLWMSEFCSEDCMIIWTTATKYNMGKVTKSEAKEIISKTDLKSIESYVPCVQRDLNVILTEEKKVRRTQKKVEPVVDATESIIIEQPIVATPEVTEPIHEVVKQENE